MSVRQWKVVRYLALRFSVINPMPSLHVDAQAVEFFANHLWKERRLEIDSSRKRIVRYSVGDEDAKTEMSILHHIRQYAREVRIPSVRFFQRDAIAFDYIAGVRGSTALAALRASFKGGNSSALAIAARIFDKLRRDLVSLQRIPVHGELTGNIYNIEDKLLRDTAELLRIAPCKELLEARLYREMIIICGLYRELCCLPFRDANPKNCIIWLPEDVEEHKAMADRLYLSNILCELGKREGYFDRHLFQLDFSSWTQLVSRFDDQIILFLHNSAVWIPRGTTGARTICWGDFDVLVSSFVRIYRFAVRKLFYQLIHVQSGQQFNADGPSIYYARTARLIARQLRRAGFLDCDQITLLCEHIVMLSSIFPERDFFGTKETVTKSEQPGI